MAGSHGRRRRPREQSRRQKSRQPQHRRRTPHLQQILLPLLRRTPRQSRNRRRRLLKQIHRPLPPTRVGALNPEVLLGTDNRVGKVAAPKATVAGKAAGGRAARAGQERAEEVVRVRAQVMAAADRLQGHRCQAHQTQQILPTPPPSRVALRPPQLQLALATPPQFHNHHQVNLPMALATQTFLHSLLQAQVLIEQ